MDSFKTIETISLDFYNNNIKTVNVKQLDTKSRYVKISCTEHGKVFKLNKDIMSAFVRYKKPDGYYVFNTCNILDDGTVLVELSQQMLAVTGKCTADIIIFYSNYVGDGDENEKYMNEAEIVSDENGNVVLHEDTLLLNGLTIADDNNGNISVLENEDGNISIEDFSDIYKLNIPVLSTMTFYVNVFPSAIDHAVIASSYEYDALIQGVGAQELMRKEMESLKSTLNANEVQRLENENVRINAENIRKNSENTRTDSETQRVENENTRISNENIRQETFRTNEENRSLTFTTNENSRQEEFVRNENNRQANETIRINNEVSRHNDFNTAMNDCNTATQEAREVTTIANQKITEMQELIVDKSIINDESISKSTTYSSEKIQEVVSKIDNKMGQLYNQNLFINGHFQIWSNVTEFVISGSEKATEICDKWFVEYYGTDEPLDIRGNVDGLLISRAPSTEPYYIYQALDYETFYSLYGKTLTLSYSFTPDSTAVPTVETKEIVVSNDYDDFITQTQINLTEDGILHWAKLEVGTVKTPCIPDSRDSLILNQGWKECGIDTNEHADVWFEGSHGARFRYNQGVFELIVSGSLHVDADINVANEGTTTLFKITNCPISINQPINVVIPSYDVGYINVSLRDGVDGEKDVVLLRDLTKNGIFPACEENINVHFVSLIL